VQHGKILMQEAQTVRRKLHYFTLTNDEHFYHIFTRLFFLAFNIFCPKFSYIHDQYVSTGVRNVSQQAAFMIKLHEHVNKPHLTAQHHNLHLNRCVARVCCKSAHHWLTAVP